MEILKLKYEILKLGLNPKRQWSHFGYFSLLSEKKSNKEKISDKVWLQSAALISVLRLESVRSSERLKRV